MNNGNKYSFVNEKYKEYHEIDNRINELLAPRFTTFGNVSFNSLSEWKWREYDRLTKRLKTIKRQIRDEKGWLRYIVWRFVLPVFSN